MRLFSFDLTLALLDVGFVVIFKTADFTLPFPLQITREKTCEFDNG